MSVLSLHDKLVLVPNGGDGVVACERMALGKQKADLPPKESVQPFRQTQMREPVF